MNAFVIISGCSGGGKSALLGELAKRGHNIVPEPGRRIVQAELECGGHALPWRNLQAFARRAVELSFKDYAAATTNRGWTFFDRGLIDALAALHDYESDTFLHEIAGRYRYHRQVFLTPPWPEIFVTDRERRHDFEAAKREYERLERVYPSLGYEVVILPTCGIVERATFVLETLAQGGPGEHL